MQAFFVSPRRLPSGGGLFFYINNNPLAGFWVFHLEPVFFFPDDEGKPNTLQAIGRP